MYLHLGREVVVKYRDIVGIFDLEKTTLSKMTKEYLAQATKENRVITVSYEMPKSFVVVMEDDGQRVYISQISAATLKKRYDSFMKSYSIFEE